METEQNRKQQLENYEKWKMEAINWQLSKFTLKELNEGKK